VRALCALCAELGGKILVHGSPDQRKLDPGDEDNGRKRGIDCFAAVADAASQAGVTYCIEPLARVQTAFVNTVAEAAAIVRQIDNPALRTMIDCSAAGQTEAEPVDALVRRWLPTGLIAHIHFNDPNRRGPGEGELAFGPILAALRESGYRGNAAIEPFDYKPDGPTCAARGIGYIRGILQTLPA
jgi:D-psicose/D-tagatose/L-ribulose 3-epimerase